MWRWLCSACLSVLCCFALVCPAYASEITDFPAPPDDGNDYYYIKLHTSAGYRLITSTCQFTYDGSKIYWVNDGSDLLFNVYSLDTETDPPEWVFSASGDSVASWNVYVATMTGWELVYTSDDIVSSSDNSEVVYEAGIQAGYEDITIEGVYQPGSGDYSGLLGVIIGLLDGIKSAVSGIVDGILDGIKGFFLPSEGYLDAKMAEFNDNLDGILGFDLDVFDLSYLAGEEAWVSDSDFAADGAIFGLEGDIPLLDTSILTDAVDYFRPVIRGLLVLFMAFFFYNQVLALLGGAPISYAGGNTSAPAPEPTAMVRQSDMYRW